MKNSLDVELLEQKNPTRTWQLWKWGMREGGVGEHEHLESKYLGE